MKNIFKKVGLLVVVTAISLSSILNAGNTNQASGNTHKNNYYPITDKKILFAYKKRVEKYQTLVVMYQSQFDAYQETLKKRKTLLPKQWKQFSRSVTNLSKAINFSEGMNLVVSSYEVEFKNKFPSYESFSKSTQSIESNYKKLRLATRQSVNRSLDLLGLEAQSVADEKAMMEQLEILRKTSRGQESAIAVANKLALHQISILEELQKTMTVQEEIQSAFLSVN